MYRGVHVRSHTLNAEAYTEHIYYMPYMPIYTPYMPKPYIYSIQNIHIQLIYIYIYYRAVSRIWIQLPFFSMPYFGRQGQCLRIKWPDNLRKQVDFAIVVKRCSVNPLVGVQAKPYEPFNTHTLPSPFGGKNFKSKNSKSFNILRI